MSERETEVELPWAKGTRGERGRGEGYTDGGCQPWWWLVAAGWSQTERKEVLRRRSDGTRSSASLPSVHVAMHCNPHPAFTS
jgi:hypothetical protein